MAKLKAAAARDLQKAIRMEAASDSGYCTCVSCGKIDHYKKMHAGHFVSGRSNGVLFDERNIAPQCPRCNLWLSGNQEMYYQYMLECHSQEVIDEILRNRNREVRFTREQLEEMRAGYRKRIKEQEKRLW